MKQDRHSDSSFTASRSRLAAVTLAACTGATMLAGQVGWMRLAQSQVGSGLLAGALSLSAAMAGLAIGAGMGGRLVLRARIHRAAVAQQLLAAAALILSPWLIAAAGTAVANAARGGDLDVAQWLLTAAVGGLLLLLNVPFGMMLPLAVELDSAGREANLSRRGGLFYALQSAGAAVGGVTLGLLLPRAIGFGWMLVTAGAAHLLLAGWLGYVGRGRRPTPAEAAPPSAALPRRRAVAWLALWLGMLGLAAELVWLRGLTFFLHSSACVYALTAAVFLSGLTLGGLGGAWLTPLRRRPGQFLAAIALLAALLLAASAQWLGYVWRVLPEQGPEGGSPLAAALLAVAVIVGPPAVLMGMAFPPLLRLASPSLSLEASARGLAGRTVARVLAFNSFGSALGPLLAYVALLGTLDERRSLLAIAVGYMIAALWAEVIDPATGWHRSSARAEKPKSDEGDHRDRRGRRLAEARLWRIPWLNIGLFAAAAAVCLWQSNQGSIFHEAYLMKTGQPSGEPASRRTFDEHADFNTMSVPVLIESRQGVVAIRQDTATGESQLWINQQLQGDDSILALMVQRRQGLLPLLLAGRDCPQTALVVGLGTGTTASGLVNAGVSRITVAELVEPVGRTEVLERFRDANDGLVDRIYQKFDPLPATQPATSPAAQDAQLQIVNADGRTLLRLMPGRWDIILVGIVFPNAPGAGGLFSREFYRLASDRLNDDGVFVHWLPLWQIAPADAASIVAAFREAFGESRGGTGIAVLGFPDHGKPMLALVGSRKPIDLSRATLARRIERLRRAAERRNRPTLADLDLGLPEQLWASLLTDGFLARWAEGACPLTDAHPRLELVNPLGNEWRFGPDNIARLLQLGYADRHYGNQVAEMLSGQVTPELLAAPLQSRRLLGEADKLPPGPATFGPIVSLLEQAVQADRANAFARFQLARLQFEQSLQRARTGRDQAIAMFSAGDQDGFQRAAGQLIEAFTQVDRVFPYELAALEDRAALQKNSGQIKAALATLDEMIRRAPRAADPRFRKAQLLADLTDAEMRAGRTGQALQAATEARLTISQARSLRVKTPDGYRRLASQLDGFVRSMAATQPGAPPASSPE